MDFYVYILIFVYRHINRRHVRVKASCWTWSVICFYKWQEGQEKDHGLTLFHHGLDIKINNAYHFRSHFSFCKKKSGKKPPMSPFGRVLVPSRSDSPYAAVPSPILSFFIITYIYNETAAVLFAPPGKLCLVPFLSNI